MSRNDGPELLIAPPAAGFAADYMAGADTLAPFYAGHPTDPRSFERKAGQVAAAFDAERRRLLPAMLRPVSEEARRRLEAIAGGSGFVVTTGQQAGILGGPLFTIYKALSAVALADALQDRLGVPVLPVFWVASEDHDWSEIDHLHLLDTANRLHRFALQDPAGGDGTAPGPSMARRHLHEDVTALVDQVRDAMPPTDFREDLLERVRAAYAPGVTVADAFESLLARLFATQPLALIQASDPTLKRASIPILRRELENGARHEELLRVRTAQFQAAGYEPQVPIATGAENVFHEGEHGRERLLRADGGWITRGRGLPLPREEALAQLESDPARFSPNVLLRPVVESAVLPTLAYVGGPAEVRYFAQTGCLFEAHGVGMPIVVPRASITVIETKTRKVLDKLSLGLDDLALPEQELAARLLAGDMPAEVADALKEVRAAIGASYGALGEAVRQIDPTLKGPIGSARSAAFAELAEIEKRVMRGLKAKNETTLEQVAKARVNLFPNGKPQERVLSPLQYLVRYGDAFIEEAREAIRYALDGDVPAWTGVECP